MGSFNYDPDEIPARWKSNTEESRDDTLSLLVASL